MPTFGPSARDDDNRAAHSGRLVNRYRQRVPQGGFSSYVLKSVLGTEAFADTNAVFFRAISEWRNQLFAVYGGMLYRIDTSGTATSLGSVSQGDTSISSNGDYLTIAAAGAYYTLTGSTLSTVGGVVFSSIGSVGFLDQYTLLTERDGRRWAWSDLGDPNTLPALNFATAESDDDDILRVATINGRVVLFKETSREIWYNTGQAGANAFRRLPGGARQTGLKSYNLLCRAEDTLFFIGNDDIARITLDGVEAQKLSYPPVDTALAQSTPTECFFYEDEGQKHVVIRFSDRASWVFDLASGEWHERAYGADHDPWPARGTARLGDDWYAALETGEIVKLTRNNADVGEPLRRTAVGETFYFGSNGASLDLLEVFGRTGDVDIGRDIQSWVRLSRDGGKTWGPEKWRSMGTIGDHDQRMTWRAQGRFKRLTVEHNVSDPADVPIFADYIMEAS